MFDLSFSPEFFLAEGEPYDRSDYAVNEDGKPTSVWSAVCMMDDQDWNDLAKNIFDCHPHYLTPETVLDMVRETNACRDLRSPIEVYIDPDHYYSVLVY